METVMEDPKVETKFDVVVEYNGVKEKVEVRPEELVRQVLEHAIHKFGQLAQPHTLSLFTEAGHELDDNKSVAQEGLKPHQRLLLRPGAVKGGRAR